MLLTRLFHAAFNQAEAEIDSYLSRNLYNSQIPLEGTRTKLQLELLLNGGLVNESSGSSKSSKFFTLRQLLALPH